MASYFYFQSRLRFTLLFLLFAALAMLWMPHTVFAQTSAPSASADLTTMNLEDLMKLEVTSVSKKEQKISQVAAAIFVITQEDIHRSGATNIPDLLRMVPGLDVAQINANTWAISARGFNSEFANKLLVLIDGRAVYTPTLGGVDWDTTDVPLEDIERIEVIRGPGGTIWGANAVNGVINIITKKSSDTLGGLLVGAGGTQQQALGTAQYGGKLSASSTYRIFSKYSDTNQSPSLEGQDARDDWHLLHGGFRVDLPTSKKDQWTFEGDLYTGSEGATLVHTVLNPPENVNVLRIADLSGGTVLARWAHTLSDRSDTSLQVSFDNSTRSGPESYVQRRTFDIDFQHHIALGARHDIVWGGEFRSSPDHTIGTIDQAWVPADRTFNLFNAFLQDEITLRPNRLFLTLGTKLEYNNFSGVDVDPSIRLAWTPNARQTLWWAVSTAYRTPSRRDQNMSAVLAAFPGPSEVATGRKFPGASPSTSPYISILTPTSTPLSRFHHMCNLVRTRP
jgi:iron complex outermembrane receptor protein